MPYRVLYKHISSAALQAAEVVNRLLIADYADFYHRLHRFLTTDYTDFWMQRALRRDNAALSHGAGRFFLVVKMHIRASLLWSYAGQEMYKS
jgi:hypothetical protein